MVSGPQVMLIAAKECWGIQRKELSAGNLIIKAPNHQISGQWQALVMIIRSIILLETINLINI